MTSSKIGKTYSFSNTAVTKITSQIATATCKVSVSNSVTVGTDVATTFTFGCLAFSVVKLGLSTEVSLLPALNITYSKPFSLSLNLNLKDRGAADTDAYYKSLFELTKQFGSVFDYTCQNGINKVPFVQENIKNAASNTSASSTFQDLQNNAVYQCDKNIYLGDAASLSAQLVVLPVVNSFVSSAASFFLLPSKESSDISLSDSYSNDTATETDVSTKIEGTVVLGVDQTEKNASISFSNTKFSIEPLLLNKGEDDESTIGYKYTLKGKATITCNGTDYSTDDQQNLMVFSVSKDKDFDYYINYEITSEKLTFSNLFNKSNVSLTLFFIVTALSDSNLSLKPIVDPNQTVAFDEDLNVSDTCRLYENSSSKLNQLSDCSDDISSLAGYKFTANSSSCDIQVPQRSVQNLGSTPVILLNKDEELHLTNFFEYLENVNDTSIVVNNDSYFNICVRQNSETAGSFPSNLTIDNTTTIKMGKVTPNTSANLAVKVSLTVGFDSDKNLYWYELCCDESTGYVFDDYNYSELASDNDGNKNRLNNQISSDRKTIYGNDLSGVFNKCLVLKKIGDTSSTFGVTTSYEYSYAFIKIIYDMGGYFVLRSLRVLTSSQLKSLVNSVNNDIGDAMSSYDTLAKVSSVGVGAFTSLAGLAGVAALAGTKSLGADYGLNMYAQENDTNEGNLFALAKEKQEFISELNDNSSSLTIDSSDTDKPSIKGISQEITISGNNGKIVINSDGVKISVGDDVSLNIGSDTVVAKVSNTSLTLGASDVDFSVSGTAGKISTTALTFGSAVAEF